LHPAHSVESRRPLFRRRRPYARNRTTRHQSLTEFGRAYYERCRTVLAEAEAADALAADQRSQPCGKLRVTMPVLFGRRCVTPILLALAQKYPNLELDISFSDRIADLAEDGYDLAIRTGDLDNKAGVIARRIARQRMIVCASPSYVETHGRPQQIEELGKHYAIIYRRSGRIRPWLFPRKDEAPTEVTPVNRLRLDDLDAIADAAASGMGLAWLPYWLISRAHSGRHTSPVIGGSALISLQLPCSVAADTSFTAQGPSRGGCVGGCFAQAHDMKTQGLEEVLSRDATRTIVNVRKPEKAG
jgi:DNA-binding transcriptional LysR family regulator